MRLVHAIGAGCALALAACTAILGNDFTIGTGGGGAGASGGGEGGESQGGDGGTTSAGGMGGGGGGMTGPGPLDCAWIDIQEVADLSGEPSGQDQWGGGRMRMTLADRHVRWIATRTADTGGQMIELFSADGDSVRVTEHHGYTGSYGFVRIDGNTTGALVESTPAGGPGRTVELMLIDDSDSSGSTATFESIAGVIGNNLADFEAGIASAGDGTASVAYSYRLTGDVHRALFLRWVSGTGVTPVVEFNNSTGQASLTSGDYEFAFMVRDADGDNHVQLGTAFEGATRARHFIIPDDVSGAVTATRDDPLSGTSPILLPKSVRRRTDDTFSAAYALFTDPAELRMGVMPAAELDTHLPTDLPVVSSITSTEVPDEAGFDATDNSLLLMGTQADPTLGVRLMLFHKDSGLRHNSLLAYPDSSIFPTDYSVERFNAVFVSDTIDTTFGGEIYAAWFIRRTGSNKDTMYLGRVECTPSGG